MKIKLTTKLILLQSILIFSCTDNETKKSTTAGSIDTSGTPDIIIGSRDVIDEVAGSAYMTRAKSFFVINGKDTSDFKCEFSTFTELNNTNLNMAYNGKKLTYQERMIELARILPVATKEFTIDSTLSIGIGRLVSTGDLAVDITNQYIQKFGDGNKAGDNKKVADFLLGSKIASDFNELLKPYAVAVKKAEVEKVFFTTKDVLYSYGKIEADSAKVPSKILDCMVWLDVK